MVNETVIELSGIRVVIADDHVPLRALVRSGLEAGGCEVCGEGASANEAVELALLHEPDVVVLDIHMPGNGIQAAREISERLPQTAIIMLTASQDDEDLFESLRAGASGYLLKHTDPRELPLAFRRVLAGEAAMTPALVSRVLESFRAPKLSARRRTSRMDELSPREREIMELLADGLPTDSVAKKLALSPVTVRVHISSVLRKLQVKDRQAALRALRHK